MTTYTELLPPTKSEPKGAAIDWTPTATNTGSALPPAGVLTIKQKRAYTSYVVCEFPTDWPGRGFHLAKLDAGTDKSEESYSCFLSANGQDKACQCKGFLYAGHCKHLAALETLIRAGKL